MKCAAIDGMLSNTTLRPIIKALRKAHISLGLKRRKNTLGICLNLTGTAAFVVVSVLSVASPVEAANTAIVGGLNQSTIGVGVAYSNGSHGSIVLSGDDDYCGADNVVGRSGITNGISLESEFDRFINNTRFGEYSPYGTSTSQVVWTGNGLTSNNIGYQSPITGGRINAMPQAFGVYSFATGCGSVATGNYSTAFATNANATGAASQAFGVAALASEATSLAIGVSSSATAISAIAIGGLSLSSGQDSLAIGTRSQALKKSGVAIGHSSQSGGLSSVAIGDGAIADQDNSVSLGSNSVARLAIPSTSTTIAGTQYNFAGQSPVGVVSIGRAGNERQLVNVAAGDVSTSSTDAVNGSQLNATNEAVSGLGDRVTSVAQNASNYLGGGADIGAKTAPIYNIQGLDQQNVGAAFTAVDRVLQAHNTSLETIQNDVLFWSSSIQAYSAKHKNSNNNFVNSRITDVEAGSITATSFDAINGSQLYALYQNVSSAFGGGSGFQNGRWIAPSFEYSIVDSAGNVRQAQSNTVGEALAGLGSSLESVNERIDHIDQNVNKPNVNTISYDEKTNAYDARRDGQATKISGIEDGKIAANSKDAVNGGQLFETYQRVASIEEKVISVAEGAVIYDRDDAGMKTNQITLVGGDPSKPVTITNVAEGKISSKSTDAVNGSQLFNYTSEQNKLVLSEAKSYANDKFDFSKNYTDQKLAEAKSYTDQVFGKLNYDLSEIKKEARQAAAIGLAVANLRYDDRPGKFSVSMGGGYWRNEGAIAFGAGYISETGNIRSNVSATTAGGHWGVGGGLSFTLN